MTDFMRSPEQQIRSKFLKDFLEKFKEEAQKMSRK
jgi:hypothetical protein